MLSLGRQNLSAPGLYYDEAIFGGLAKDFLSGQVHGQHLPDTHVISVDGHPFPVFVQTYLGALKSWLLMPGLGLFGSNLPALRLTNQAWALVALLIFMLWIRRWLGLGAAVLAGAILAFDSNYFFLSLFDWGSTMPSFLCRFACFYFAFLWWQRRRVRDLFLAGVCAGLGFFNKIDFAVLILGTGIAALYCYWQSLRTAFRQRPLLLAWPCLGFIVGAGPMISNVPRILSLTSSTGPQPSGEFTEKINATLAMYDGSYFYRLMNAGGVFGKMYETASAAWSPFGILFGIAGLILLACVLRNRAATPTARAALFLLLATFLTTLGAMFLPGAVRIHHTILVFPFPQLIIALAAVLIWRDCPAPRPIHRVARGLMVIGLTVLLIGQIFAIRKTQGLIRETGGRGWWSESFNQFCQQIKTRSDLTVVSLDWGFNEQLLFLTNGPQLVEPFWTFGRTGIPALPKETNYVYLVHPPEYTLFDYGYLKAAQADKDFEIQPWSDRQNHVAFYTIRYRGP